MKKAPIGAFFMVLRSFWSGRGPAGLCGFWWISDCAMHQVNLSNARSANSLTQFLSDKTFFNQRSRGHFLGCLECLAQMVGLRIRPIFKSCPSTLIRLTGPHESFKVLR